MLRKTVAAFLAASMMVGVAGCDAFGVRKEMGNVDGVIKEYGNALSKLDEEKILDLTNWGADSKEYEAFKESFTFDGYAEYIWNVYEATAGTITLDYKGASIKVKGDKASVDVTYVIVDWKTLYNEQYSGADDLVKAITDSMNVITTEGSLEFEKDGNDWKISKITKLDELLEFGKKSPNLTNKEMPTKPADDTDPTDEPAFPTGTQFADSYQKAIAAYLKVLDDNMAAITAVQETFRIDPVGIYDIDGNGIPELYFLACKDSSQVMNSSLFIYSYNENAGEALKQIEVPDIIYMAGSGGLFQMYATSNRLIITHAGGEDADFKYWTEIYNFQWDLIASYRRNYLYDYNAPEDQATTVKYYEEEAEITEEQYNKVFKEDANNTVIVLARNYTPSPSDVEYPLVSKPSFAMLGYESACTYLKSLQG
ncbi:MAG: hypothetical protein K5881_06830 [Saccharofermentans sp.]|nr:hypothetical protein [Saccharofermentans sp.]